MWLRFGCHADALPGIMFSSAGQGGRHPEPDDDVERSKLSVHPETAVLTGQQSGVSLACRQGGDDSESVVKG